MPRWLIALRFRLRSLAQWRRVDRELDEELRFHVDRDVQERMTGGATPAEARRAAMLAMGAIETNRDACREIGPARWIVTAAARRIQDARFALRLFRKHPGPVAAAVGGLGLAIGVSAATFSIVNASLLRPFGMDDPWSVVSISRPGVPGWVGWTYPQFLEMRRAPTVTVEASLSSRLWIAPTGASKEASDRHDVLFVSGGYLDLFGGRPHLGRSLAPSDDAPGAPAVVVISQRLWTVAYGADPDVIGRMLRVNGLPATVVGVMQAAFTGPRTAHPAVWAPLGAMDDLGAGTPVTSTSGPSVEVVGRLRPGVSRQGAQDSLSALLSQTVAPGAAPRPGARQAVQVSRAAAPVDMAFGDDYAGLAIVFTIVGLVLILACANTANLLMASAITRMREVGIRLAMGATRRRLVTQLITESLMLGIIAGAFGLLLADWLVPVFGRLADVPPDIDLTPDGRVAAFASVVGLLCGAAAGLSPARFGSRGNVLAALKGDAAPAGGAIVPSRFRLSFVGLQAAVSMLLLVSAALLTRSAVRMTSLDVGFDADRVLGVALGAPRRDFDEAAYLSGAAAALRGIPSVQAVSMVQDVPFGCCRERDRFSDGGRTYELDVIRGDADFFRTLGIQVLRGRPFSADEVRREAPVALISESVARVFFSGREAIGSVLADVPSAYIRQQPATIIGVVADGLLTRVGGEAFGAIYRPLVHRASPPGFLVRTATPGTVAPAIDEALRRLDPRVRATTTRLRDGVESYLDTKRRLAWLLGPVAVLALLLAALGTYGVTAFATSQRLEEVSVRMALGASASDVFRLLATQGLRPVVLGLLVGLGAALIVGRVAAQELAGVSPHDPVAVGGALAVLLAFAAIAVVVPARRAARSDPAALLRRT